MFKQNQYTAREEAIYTNKEDKILYCSIYLGYGYSIRALWRHKFSLNIQNYSAYKDNLVTFNSR